MKGKDWNVIKWLLKSCKKQLVPIIVLILSNTIVAFIGVQSALVSKYLIDAAAPSNTGKSIAYFAVMLISLTLLQLLLNFINRYYQERVKAGIDINLKNSTLQNLINKDYSETLKFHTGELLTRLTSDVTVISTNATSILPDLFAMLTRLIYSFVWLVIISPSFAIVFLSAGLLLFITAVSFRGVLKKLHKNVQNTEGTARSFIQEILESLLVVKVFQAEGTILKRSMELLSKHFKARTRRATISAYASTGFSLVFQIGYLYAFIWGAFCIASNSITLGTLLAMVQLVGQIQNPLAGLSGLLPNFYSMVASSERLIELQNLPEEPDSDEKLKTDDYERIQRIVFEDLSFSYDRDKILENASLVIEKGDFAVISGISGIGKSTLLKLLLGVFHPTGGDIYFESDQGRITAGKSTRGLLTYVPQGNLLLSGTIRDNIIFVKQDATDEQILEAARISCADEFINELPLGLDTLIGEKGQGLSEGQVQRLSIARAVLTGAPILLLDEATSALDGATEVRLLENLKSMKNKTCIIISHKKAAFDVCNTEIRIEGRKIISRKVNSN